MAKRKKPTSISVTLQNRSLKKSSSFTVYDSSIKELVKKFKKAVDSM